MSGSDKLLPISVRDRWLLARILSSFFSKLMRGVRSTLDGVGLEELEIVPEWDSDRDFLSNGGAKRLRKEVDDLARECREARSDSKALNIMEDYLRKKK